MLFTSSEFLLFVFVTVIVYYLCPKKLQWIILLLASYLFYILLDVRFVLFIFVTTISAYILTLKMDKVQLRHDGYLAVNKIKMSRVERKIYKEKEKKIKRKYMLITLFINLGILIIVKYTNFFILNLNSIKQVFQKDEISFVNLIVPLGISFYTFQTLSYVIDIYWNKYKPEKNFGKVALFVSFFPQLVQGPISRFDDLSLTLFQEHTWDFKRISFGVQRILWGVFKKLVIADRVVIAVKTITNNPTEYFGGYVFLGMFLYALQLYADFSGGIDITIGIAEMFGISVKENFIRPFFSKSIKEFWTRWHITMGTWFKDYIFYPVSISKCMMKISKFSKAEFGRKIGKRVPVYFAAIIVWFTTGIWHGASWNFIAWGLTNCIVILISQELDPIYRWFHQRFHVKNKLSFRIFQVLRTVLLMSCIRMFDCYHDVPLTFKMFGTMFTEWNYVEVVSSGLFELGLQLNDYIILLIGLAIFVIVSLKQRKISVREQIYNKKYVIQVLVWYGLFLAIVIFGIYGIGYEQSQFIYNQF